MATHAINPEARHAGSSIPRRLIDRIPLSPARTRRNGPLTRRRLVRFYGALGLIYLAALAPVLLGMSAQWQAFALGIMFPGGGFLYAGGIVGVIGAVLSVAAFAVIMFIWWARGVILGRFRLP